MTEYELKKQILEWEQKLLYHLGNYHRAIEVGALASRDGNQTQAAECASILLALRQLGETRS